MSKRIVKLGLTEGDISQVLDSTMPRIPDFYKIFSKFGEEWLTNLEGKDIDFDANEWRQELEDTINDFIEADVSSDVIKEAILDGLRVSL